MATTKEIRISQLPLEKDIRGMMTVGVNSANQSVKIPIGEVINEEIRKVKRTYGYSRIDALTVGSSADDVASALIAENESKRTMPNVGDILVDWGGVIRVPVVRQTVQTGGEKPIYSFSFRTADNTATKTVKIQGSLYEPQTVVSVETVKDVTQQQISTLDTQLAEEVTARLNQDDVLEAKITEEKNVRIAKDDVIFTVTKDTINDAETVGDAKWAWALTPSVSDEELNARIAKRANFYVDVSLDTLGFLPYLKYIKLESIPENTDGVFSGLIPPASEFGYVETTNIKVKYNAKHKRWIALFYGAEYIIPTATADANGLMSKEDKATLDALPTQLTAEQTAREQADTAINGEIQGIKDKGSLFDLFKAAGATLNSDGTTWSMNGITDLTTQELINAYQRRPIGPYLVEVYSNVQPRQKFRTNFPIPSWYNPIIDSADRLCFENPLIEVLQIGGTKNIAGSYVILRSCTDWLYGAKKLRIILGPQFDVGIIKFSNRDFKQCQALEDIRLKYLKSNIYFQDSPNLNKDSIVFMITEATPLSPITITLHPTAYAMATADPEIQAELEKQPNISLAEGEPTA